MSWGRQDDTYWRHPKTIALIEQGDVGLAAAGAFWIINAYCRSQRRGEFSIWDAVAALRRPPNEIEPLLERLTAAPEGYERGFLLRKQTSSTSLAFVINSFDEYRSKNEAKALAGSQGGKKKAENTYGHGLAKSKQTSSRPLADAQQNPSRRLAPSPDLPIPDPRSPDPDLPSPDPGAALATNSGARRATGTGDQITHVDQVTQAVFAAGLQLPRPGNALEHRILGALPVPRERLVTAIDATSKAEVPNWSYFVRCLENPVPRKPKRESRYEAMQRGGDAFVNGTGPDPLAWTRDPNDAGKEGTNA